MKSVCVFCGSASGSNPVYAAAARELGAELVRRDLGLVYGGGRIGLMGEVAIAVTAAGGTSSASSPKRWPARRSPTPAPPNSS